MGKLHRYLLVEVALFILGAVGVFIFVFLTGNAVRGAIGMLVEGQITLRLFFQIIWLMIPFVAVYALPLGFLAGILLALGRFSSTREILAMKASGMSVWSIARPVFLVALIGCVFSAWFNNELGPKNKGAYRDKLANSLEEDPLRFFKAGEFISDFPGFIIYVRERVNDEMRGFKVWQIDDEGRVERYAEANDAHIEFLREESTILLTMLNGSTEVREPNPLYDTTPGISGVGSFAEFRVRLELDRILDRGSKFTQKPSYLTFRELRKRVAEDPENSLKYRVQIQQNFAMSVSIFALVIVAVPLGIRVGRKETLTNLGVALGLALLYYFLLTIATWFMDMPVLAPELLIWIPNLLYFGIGIWLMNRANRH
ncbi:LptF/LptG family permease [Puniceicoccus vermicola]|uniref:LptF/LptG family permease n=1 Tax=Puniceicoccus vermicola TaxID=388746 RepID=A0A7X1B4Q9_9BACT|nr:LptF/LptG family permease [Puniceicoccus vermicola]MBC2604350.1 LptF/LptG family permease [Puniceicoccus vermicola]